MNTLSLSTLLRCVCTRETVRINNRKYYVRSRLGEGGFSYVDLVEDTHSRKLFALKRITCHSKEDERTGMREVEICHSFNHPNIIAIEDHMLVPMDNVVGSSVISELLVLLPFYRRGTLQDELDLISKKHLDSIKEQRIIQLFRGICEGVKVLHHYQPYAIAHRDLKPANVLLDEDDTPVLMDFGSATKARVELSDRAQAVALQDLAAERCSMPYRAPELFNVASQGVVDEKTDIWSLGCVLYAMAFHQSPFDDVYTRGDSIALAVTAGNVKIPQYSGYSSSLHDLILFMLKVEPSERPTIDNVIERVENLRNTLENRI